MKALTLTQPWATLVALGHKKIETRSWWTAYRGPLAIHAAKGFPRDAKDLCQSSGFCRTMGWPVVPKPLTQAWLDDNAARIKALPLGKVIAVCQLAGCQRIVAGASSAYCAPNEILPPPEPELWWGNYEHGRYAWLLKAVNPIEPVPVKGALGLWEWNQ